MKNLLRKMMFVSCLAFIVGCNNNSNLESKESLNLKSPNGMLIATDMADLKHKTSQIIRSSNGGIDKEFEVTKVQYEDVPTGFVALIEYETTAGEIGNYAIFSSDAHVANADSKSDNKQVEAKGDVSIKSISCTGDCVGEKYPKDKCFLHIANDNGKITYTCSKSNCSSCAMIVEYF